MDETSVAGRRFGLTADTHDNLTDWPKVAAALTAAWGDVDAVLHCGDISSIAALDTLSAVAPVYATRNTDDPPAAPPRLTDGPRVLNLGGVLFVNPGSPSLAKTRTAAVLTIDGGKATAQILPIG